MATVKMSTIDTKVKDSLMRKSINLNVDGTWEWNNNKITSEVVAGLIGSESFFRQMNSDAVTNHVNSYRAFVLEAKQSSTPVATGEDVAEGEIDRGAVISGNRVALPFELHNISHIPSEIDKKYIGNFYYHVDSNCQTSFMYKYNGMYTLIPQSLSGVLDVDKALLKNEQFYNTSMHKFEELLNLWSDNICNIYNANHNATLNDDEPVNEYARNNIPVIILSRAYIVIKGSEYNANTDPSSDRIITRIRASHVTFNLDSTGKKRLTYADYVDLIIANYPSTLKRMTKLPKIYANEGEAFKLLDLTKYQSNEVAELNDAWCEFFSKFTADEKLIVLAMIWGVFYSKNSSRMGLWIYDPDGYSGKSAFLRALTVLLGEDLVASIQKDSLSNQFWAAKIWDKRLVTYPDCKNRKFALSEKYHQITGGDGTDVENKGQRSFNVNMEAKIFIASNELPDIDPNRKHERSRIVMVKPRMSDEVLQKIAVKDNKGNYVRNEMGEVETIGDRNFTDNLIAGGEAMLINAYQAYQKLCPNDADFIIPSSVLANVLNLETAERISYDSIFADMFIEDADSHITSNDLYNAYVNYCAENPTKMNAFKSKDAFSDFKNFLSKDMKLEFTRMKNQAKTRIIQGIRIKSRFQSSTQEEPKHKSPSTHFAEIKNTKSEIREDILNPNIEIDWVSE